MLSIEILGTMCVELGIAERGLEIVVSLLLCYPDSRQDVIATFKGVALPT